MNVRDLAAPLYAAKGWMKLLGVLMILNGLLVAATIVGIVVAWLPIWTGVLLFQAAGAAERAHETDNAVELTTALAKLKTYFMILGILALIMLIFGVIGIFIGGSAGLMEMARMPG